MPFSCLSFLLKLCNVFSLDVGLCLDVFVVLHWYCPCIVFVSLLWTLSRNFTSCCFALLHFWFQSVFQLPVPAKTQTVIRLLFVCIHAQQYSIWADFNYAFLLCNCVFGQFFLPLFLSVLFFLCQFLSDPHCSVSSKAYHYQHQHRHYYCYYCSFTLAMSQSIKTTTTSSSASVEFSSASSVSPSSASIPFDCLAISFTFLSLPDLCSSVSLVSREWRQAVLKTLSDKKELELSGNQLLKGCSLLFTNNRLLHLQKLSFSPSFDGSNVNLVQKLALSIAPSHTPCLQHLELR